LEHNYLFDYSILSIGPICWGYKQLRGVIHLKPKII